MVTLFKIVMKNHSSACCSFVICYDSMFGIVGIGKKGSYHAVGTDLLSADNMSAAGSFYTYQFPRDAYS